MTLAARSGKPGRKASLPTGSDIRPGVPVTNTIPQTKNTSGIPDKSANKSSSSEAPPKGAPSQISEQNAEQCKPATCADLADWPSSCCPASESSHSELLLSTSSIPLSKPVTCVPEDVEELEEPDQCQLNPMLWLTCSPALERPTGSLL